MGELLATDRCDRCGAQAYVRTRHPLGDRDVDMLWCAHHVAEHRDALAGHIVTDERATLTPSHSGL